jgi:hypothetical protein
MRGYIFLNSSGNDPQCNRLVPADQAGLVLRTGLRLTSVYFLRKVCGGIGPKSNPGPEPIFWFMAGRKKLPKC